MAKSLCGQGQKTFGLWVNFYFPRKEISVTIIGAYRAPSRQCLPARMEEDLQRALEVEAESRRDKTGTLQLRERRQS